MLRRLNRSGLLEAFIAMVTIVFLVLTVLDYLHTDQAARTEAETVLTQSEGTATVELLRLSAVVRTLIAQLDEGCRRGTVSVKRPETVNALAMPVLAEYAPLTSINVGDPAGNGYLLMQTSSAWKCRIKNGNVPSDVTWVSMDLKGRETARQTVHDDYDPRRRPWYRNAPPSGAVFWSSPYLFRTSLDMGITASKVLSTKEVVGVDLKLKDLSTFLAASTARLAGTRIVITDLAGNVLASSDATRFCARIARPGARLPVLADSEFALYREAVVAHGKGGTFQRLATSNGVVFTRVSTIEVSPGERLRIILAVPRAVFMGNFSRLLAWKICAYLALLCSASLIYLKRYILPLRELVRLVSACDFGNPRLIPPSPRSDEVGMLYNHVNQMTGKLIDGMTALGAKEAHYRLLTENMEDVIWRASANFVFTYISPSDERRRGIPASEVLGRPIWATLAPDSLHLFRELAQRQLGQLTRGEPLAAEVLQAEQLTATGSIWVEMVCTPVYNDAGQLVGFQGVTRDISGRKEAEEEVRAARDYLNSILNTIADPVFVKDKEHRLVLVNDAECALCGCSREELLGKNDYDFFPPEQVEVFWQKDDMVLETGESNVNEEVVTDASGELRTIITRKRRYIDPAGHRFIVGVIRDITELREAQNEVVASARQAGMAEIAVNVLHNVGNVLNSVTVSAGHVLRMVQGSKVAGVSRAVALINDHAADLGSFFSSDPKGKLLPDYLAKLAGALEAEQQGIIEELDRLRKSVEHIEDVIATQQRYAGASGIIQPVRIRTLLEDALHINSEVLMRHGVTVAREFAEVPELPLDKARVLLILVNLVRNAAYAMAAVPDRPHRLMLHLEMSGEGEGRTLHIRVADNGEGIPPENMTSIFAHGFTTRKGGHGFGLHSCALAANEMGGSLTAESAGAGAGACFTLEIPVQGGV